MHCLSPNRWAVGVCSAGYDLPGGIIPSTAKWFINADDAAIHLDLSLSLIVFGCETFTFRIKKQEEIRRAFAVLD